MEWLKEWAVPLSAGATFLLALAAFWAIRQTYKFRKEDRKRERSARSTEELCQWTEEALRLLSLPHNDENKDKIYQGLTDLLRMSVAMSAAAITAGSEFEGLTKRALSALANYHKAMRAKITKNKQIEAPLITEFVTSFAGLQLYLNLLRSWDYEYDKFIKDACQNVELPLSEHLQTYP